MKKRVYVASSWRNVYQPQVVALLRDAGHEVYDFRHPRPGNDGFRWKDVGPPFGAWPPAVYRDVLQHPVAVDGHRLDVDAMAWADTCVLVLPAGRSASFELGWCVRDDAVPAHRGDPLMLVILWLAMTAALFLRARRSNFGFMPMAYLGLEDREAALWLWLTCFAEAAAPATFLWILWEVV